MQSDTPVYIVGAGPGDPDLLTVKALRLIRQAEVVVYDRLVSPDILQLIPSGSTRIFVGKETGKHHMGQDEINRLLVQLVTDGRSVVRLKGGDPFIFGRGSEEAMYLSEHKIPFEIVPGITSASACTTYAGIPLTHRGMVSGVKFITGHCRNDNPLDLDWDKLADPDTTLVVYMGLANLQQISAELVRAGLPQDTPAAAIENGTTERQRRCITTLEKLPAEVAARGFKAPAMIVIGRVVELANQLDWFEVDNGAASFHAEDESRRA